MSSTCCWLSTWTRCCQVRAQAQIYLHLYFSCPRHRSSSGLCCLRAGQSNILHYSLVRQDSQTHCLRLSVLKQILLTFGCVASKQSNLMNDCPALCAGVYDLSPSSFPGDFRLKRSPVYFLKPSYWSQRKKRYVEVSSVYETEVNGAPAGGDSTEPISPEFRGKEAIR